MNPEEPPPMHANPPAKPYVTTDKQRALDRAAIKWLSGLAPISYDELKGALCEEEGFSQAEASATVQRLVLLGWAEEDPEFNSDARVVLMPTKHGVAMARSV